MLAKFGTFNTPDVDKDNTKLLFVDNCKLPLSDDKPTFDAPICNDGVVKLPIGTCKLPVNVPPVNGKSRVECPVRVAVIVPALKLPEPSRDTMVDAVLLLVAVVALFATNPEVVNVTNLSLPMVPGVISALTIKLEEKLPDESK